MIVKAFVIRRYQNTDKEGGKDEIDRAINVGVVLAEDKNGAYQKMVSGLHGKSDTILTENMLHQQVIRQPSFTYFLEEVSLNI